MTEPEELKPTIRTDLPLKEYVDESAKKLPEFDPEFYYNKADMKGFYFHLQQYIAYSLRATYKANLQLKEIHSMFKNPEDAKRLELAQTSGTTFSLYDNKSKFFISLSKRTVKEWYRHLLK